MQRKRTKGLFIQLSQEEYARLDKMAKELKVSKRTLISCISRLELPPQNNDLLLELISQLRYIGNNLNQIAMVANAIKVIDAENYQANVTELNNVIFEIKQYISQPCAILKVDTNGHN